MYFNYINMLLFDYRDVIVSLAGWLTLVELTLTRRWCCDRNILSV